MATDYTKCAIGFALGNAFDNLATALSFFGDIYALMAHNLFFDDYDSFQAANTSMFGKEDWKQRLEDYFGIEL
jgi:hypothetical protein